MARSSKAITSPTGASVSTTTLASLWMVPTTLNTLAASIAALSAPRCFSTSHNAFWQAVHLGRAARGMGPWSQSKYKPLPDAMAKVGSGIAAFSRARRATSSTPMGCTPARSGIW